MSTQLQDKFLQQRQGNGVGRPAVGRTSLGDQWIRAARLPLLLPLHTQLKRLSHLGRPDVSFVAVPPSLRQLTSPNFSIYVHFQTQGTEMLRRSGIKPGYV